MRNSKLICWILCKCISHEKWNILHADNRSITDFPICFLSLTLSLSHWLALCDKQKNTNIFSRVPGNKRNKIEMSKQGRPCVALRYYDIIGYIATMSVESIIKSQFICFFLFCKCVHLNNIVPLCSVVFYRLFQFFSKSIILKIIKIKKKKPKLCLIT